MPRSGACGGLAKYRRRKSPRKRAEETFEKVQEYAVSIVETIHEPLIVFASDLTIIKANRSFYNRFRMAPEETEERFVYSRGDRSLVIPVIFLL